MTYEEYQAESMRRQRDYIAQQQSKMLALDAARTVSGLTGDYKLAALTLGYPPLTAQEIADRQAQLREMEARIEETHGDTPTMRLMYEFHMDRTQ